MNYLNQIAVEVNVVDKLIHIAPLNEIISNNRVFATKGIEKGFVIIAIKDDFTTAMDASSEFKKMLNW